MSESRSDASIRMRRAPRSLKHLEHDVVCKSRAKGHLAAQRVTPPELSRERRAAARRLLLCKAAATLGFIVCHVAQSECSTRLSRHKKLKTLRYFPMARG